MPGFKLSIFGTMPSTPSGAPMMCRYSVAPTAICWRAENTGAETSTVNAIEGSRLVMIVVIHVPSDSA